MAQYQAKCGPYAIDYYDNYYNNGSYYYRYHEVSGNGSITGCNGNNSSNHQDYYTVRDGITELSDECFSAVSIRSVVLPSSLKRIGNNCFKKSKIEELKLPEDLTEIGHNNFPSTLTSIEIPKNIKVFYVDNVYGCSDLKSITVHEDNKYFKSKDGVLYNYDMTEILFCPNAKTGKVIIPNTVTRIGDYCFAHCNKLEMLVIPTSVEEIGDYAFLGIVIKKLNVRNSVKSIGEGCFKSARISEEFKFSNQINSLPQEAFQDFKCVPELNFLNRLELIGTESLSTQYPIFPEKVSLYKTKEIHEIAFIGTKSFKTIELFSGLDQIGKDVLHDTNKDLILRCFLYAPIKVCEDSLGYLGENATLVVPKGTKIIYENTVPWFSFPNIEEWEIDEDKNEEGEVIKVSDEIVCKRLQSIAESKGKVDRFYLKEIIEDLSQTYLYIDSEEEYEEAINLIAYNRSFTPAIVPELEKQLCKEWTNKYKLRIIENTLLKSYASPLVFSDPKIIQPLPEPDVVSLPLPEPIEIQSKKTDASECSVTAFFNEDILKQLQNQLTLTRHSLKIAVSWFANYSLFKQIKQMASDGIKIQLIINNDLINNGGYCLNFNELIEQGVELSLVEYPHLLHHKFVIIDDNLLITGSYNWTRFSAKNYENIVIIKDEMIVEQYCNEFEELLENAEFKKVEKMPEYVKERPEYDRSAFKQYITEELDAQARETSDERDKITALKKAAELNSKYLEKINPGVQDKYKAAFKVVDDKVNIQNAIISTVNQVRIQQQKVNSKTPSEVIPASKPIPKISSGKGMTRAQEKIIADVKASLLIMCLDISGSMGSTYSQGHVHEITKKALSAALTMTNQNAVNIWTFGDDASFVGSYGLNQIDQIYKILNKNEGTNLQKFVSKADSSIEDNALCIIFTDDDSSSISAAIEGMKKRKDVFWQIIAYESSVNNIQMAVKNVKNTSIVSLSDYQSKTDEEISSALLKDYIIWKSKRIK